MFCTYCGTSNKHHAKQCTNCGEPFEELQSKTNILRLTFLNLPPFPKKFAFFRDLFDFSFHRLISLKMIRFLYGLSFISVALISLLLIFLGFKASWVFGCIVLFVIVPLILLLTVIYIRVFIEMALITIRMADRMDNPGVTEHQEHSESKEDIEWKV